MKTFDFNHPQFKKHTSPVQSLLRSAFKTRMSKEVFVAKYRKLPTRGSKKGRRSPSYLRSVYRRLKRNYAFFV